MYVVLVSTLNIDFTVYQKKAKLLGGLINNGHKNIIEG